jgi:hypothetical protein
MIWGRWLQKPHENHGSFAKRAREGDLLTGFFAPREFGLFDKEL